MYTFAVTERVAVGHNVMSMVSDWEVSDGMFHLMSMRLSMAYTAWLCSPCHSTPC